MTGLAEPVPVAGAPVDPRAHDRWEETPAEAARYDRAWDADDHDIHDSED